ETDRVRLRPGWITIAAKEFADHLLSVRLYVLLIVLGIAALIPLYFAAEQIRSVAANASITPAVFLYLFQLSPEGVPILRVALWLLTTILYVAFWLAFGLLLSVVIRRAATSALVAFGTWLFVAVPFFGPFLISFISGVLAPDDPNARHLIGQVLPSTLYSDISSVILNPTVQTTSR